MVPRSPVTSTAFLLETVGELQRSARSIHSTQQRLVDSGLGVIAVNKSTIGSSQEGGRGCEREQNGRNTGESHAATTQLALRP